MKKGPKFTLHSAQFRTSKRDLLLDVVVDGKVVEDYVVGWVEILGSEDPKYLRNITPILVDYKDTIDSLQKELKEEKDPERVKELSDAISENISELMNASVVEAICDWDEDFFEEKFSKEYAKEIFKDPDNNIIYNQIAGYMKHRENFLPTVTE